MNKKFIIVLLVVIIALVGFFYFANKAETPTQNEVGSQGKLDINAVCDGVLAYMTFPDGASADKYVLECKEGKHPEVIEQYKESMGLGDGANI